MIVLRSMLFIPGNNLRMIQKAKTLAADAVILDLEDAVPLLDKETARLFIRDSVSDLASCGVQVFVRLNAASTGLIEEDLDWVIQPGLTGLVMPKAELHRDIVELQQAISLRQGQRKDAMRELMLVAQIESALGLLHAYQLAAAPGVTALAFGALDYARDLGISLSSEGTELLYPRSHISVAARAAEVRAIDTPWFDIEDQEGLLRETQQARQLGFDGKLLIHPRQIEVVNSIFSPLESEIIAARKVIEAFEQAESQGMGAVSLEGKMIDVASYKLAKDIVDRARAITDRKA